MIRSKRDYSRAQDVDFDLISKSSFMDSVKEGDAFEVKEKLRDADFNPFYSVKDVQTHGELIALVPLFGPGENVWEFQRTIVESPLSAAIYLGHEEIVDLLLDYAKKHPLLEGGQAVLEAKLAYPHVSLSGGAQISPAVSEKALHLNAGFWEASALSANTISHTPFTLALVMGKFEMAEKILEAGAKPFYRPGQEVAPDLELPLHIAIRGKAPKSLIDRMMQEHKVDRFIGDVRLVGCAQYSAQHSPDTEVRAQGLCGRMSRFFVPAQRPITPEVCTPMQLAERYRKADPRYASELIDSLNSAYPAKRFRSERSISSVFPEISGEFTSELASESGSNATLDSSPEISPR